MNKLVEVESIETSIPNIRIFKIGKILCVTIVNAYITNAGVIFTIPPNIKILHSTVFATVNSDNHSSEIEINANGISSITTDIISPDIPVGKLTVSTSVFPMIASLRIILKLS